MYLVWYGVERMVVEGLRTDSLMTPIFNLRVSQVLSAVLVVIGLVFLIINFIRKKDTIDVPVKRLERKKA